MFTLCKQGIGIIDIRIGGIERKSLVEVLPCRIRFSVLDQVDGNQRQVLFIQVTLNRNINDTVPDGIAGLKSPAV